MGLPETSQFLLNGNHEGSIRLSPKQEVVVFNGQSEHISVQIGEDGVKAHVRITSKDANNPVLHFVDHIWDPREKDPRYQFTRIHRRNENNGTSVLAEEEGKETVVFDRKTHILSFPQGEIRWDDAI